MRRIRLSRLFVFCVSSLGLLCSSASAQSSAQAATPSDRKVDLSVVRSPFPRSRPVRRPEIFYCDTPDTSCRTTQDTYPLADLRDLFVFVTWPGVSGQHVQTVQFFLPDGSLYSSQKTQFTVGGRPVFAANAAPAPLNQVGPTPPAPHLMADANKVHAEGIPALLMKSRGDSAVLTVLPVAGTYITQRSLSGSWRVRVLLDDRLAVESEFTLAPRPPATSNKAEAEEVRE